MTSVVWEYEVIYLPDDWRVLKMDFDEMGRAGWELVSTTRLLAIFKRPLQ